MRRLQALCAAVFILLAACSKKNEMPRESDPSTTPGSEQTGGQQEESKYRQVELDFGGHSSEGGFILAYYDDGDRLAKFDVYILSERGKVVFQFDTVDPNQIAVVETDYEYEKSISESEGDVKIASQNESTFIIRDGNKISPPDEGTLRIYESAMKVISGSK